MDRGFNLLFQGNRSNFGGQSGPDFRERTNLGDRRFNNNEFYNNGSMMNNPNNNRFANGPMQNNGSNWNNAPNQLGFTNQGGQGQGGMNGPVLNALHQQNLLSALMSTQGGKGLLAQNQNIAAQGQQNNARFQNRYTSGNNRGRSNKRGQARPGDKRKNTNNQQQGGGFSKQGKKGFQGKKNTPNASPKITKEEVKVPEIDIPDDQVVVPDSLKESVEKLRSRTDIKRNVADEDVEKLEVFCYTGKGYQCKTCGSIVGKNTVFAEHAMSKNHVMKVIDARTAKKYQAVRDILDIDLTSDDWFSSSEAARSIIIKQAKALMKVDLELKAKKEAAYNRTPSNFFNFNMELRKSVIKREEEVIITSLVESNVAVKDFTGEKFFGCEFVRAVTGFHCRLCSINIREAKGVIPHIESKLHKTNYASYTRKNPEYEKTQREQNQDLFEIMSQHDGKSVVLAESANVEGSQFLSLLDSQLVRIPSVMKPEAKKDKVKEVKEGEELKTDKQEEIVDVGKDAEEETVENVDDEDEVKAEGETVNEETETAEIEEDTTEETVDGEEEIEDNADVDAENDGIITTEEG